MIFSLNTNGFGMKPRFFHQNQELLTLIKVIIKEAFIKIKIFFVLNQILSLALQDRQIV
jgi:hypothetical protein